MPTTVLHVADEPVEVAWEPIGRTAYDELVERYSHRDTLVVNESEFGPALLHACLSHLVLEDGETLTEITLDECHGMWRTWPADAVDTLYGELLDACAPTSIEWARRRLAKDGRLALEVRAACALGIPHSVFVGWDRRDQALVLALEVNRTDVCPGCGVPAADRDDPGAWEPRASECVHCEAKQRYLDTIPEEARARVHVSLVPGTEEDPDAGP